MICQQPGVLQDFDNHDNKGDGDGNDPKDGDGDDNDDDDPNMMSTQHDPPRTWCVPQQSDSTLLEALQLFEGEPCKNNGKNDDDNNDYGNNNKHNHLQPFKGMPRSQNLK